MFRANTSVTWRCGEGAGREPQILHFPCIVVCFLLKNIDTHKHTYSPFPFSSSLSLLFLMSAWERRKGGGIIMEGEKELLLGK